jgi:excisionase family DNA binding protein
MTAVEKEIARYQWLSPAEAGARVGVTDETVVRWIKQAGGLKALDIGTKANPRYRIRPDWLDAFVARRSING